MIHCIYFENLIQVHLQVAGLAIIYEVQRNSRAEARKEELRKADAMEAARKEELRKQEVEVLNSVSFNKLAF